MNIPFTTALITGSSRGIGRGIAVKLATEGVRRIAVHYCTRRDEAEKTAALLRDTGAEVFIVQADVSEACRAEAMVDEAAQQLGGCEIFVHSVIPPLSEIYEHKLATEVSLAKWQLAFDTQVRAFYVGARAAAKHMTRGGRILALTSNLGDKPAAGSLGSAWVRPRRPSTAPAGTSRWRWGAKGLPSTRSVQGAATRPPCLARRHPTCRTPSRTGRSPAGHRCAGWARRKTSRTCARSFALRRPAL